MSLDPAFIQAAHRLKLTRLRPDAASSWATPQVQIVGGSPDHGAAWRCSSSSWVRSTSTSARPRPGWGWRPEKNWVLWVRFLDTGPLTCGRHKSFRVICSGAWSRLAGRPRRRYVGRRRWRVSSQAG